MITIKNRARIRTPIAVVLLLSVFVPVCFSEAEMPPALAQGAPYLNQGIESYKEENFDEALPLLQRARKEDPNSSLAAYYLGITYKQLQDYKNAKSHLKDAVSLTPKIKEALLELVDVLYQLNELEEAAKFIEVAEREDIKPPQIAFMKGLILLKKGENLEAVKSFERAKGLDDSLAKAADYQIGLAYLKQKKFDEAKRVFKEIVVVDPNSGLAALSNEYIEAIKRKEEVERPFRFTIGTAGQYDTNVVLKPSDTTIATDITDEADWREVYTFTGEYRRKMTERFSLSPQYSLYRAHQNDIGILDVTSHTFTVTPNYNIDKGTVGLPIGYNYTDVGERKYLTTISASPLLNYMIGKTKMAQVAFKYQRNDFSRNPIIADENRDSNNFAASAGLYRFFAENKGFLGLRYEANRDDAKGANWRFFGNRITATLLYPFLKKFKINLTGDIFFQDFEKTNTIFNIERSDKIYSASSMLAYEFLKNAELQFRHTYVRDSSNITIYDYNRNMYSLGLEYKF